MDEFRDYRCSRNPSEGLPAVSPANVGFWDGKQCFDIQSELCDKYITATKFFALRPKTGPRSVRHISIGYFETRAEAEESAAEKAASINPDEDWHNIWEVVERPATKRIRS